MTLSITPPAVSDRTPTSTTMTSLTSSGMDISLSVNSSAPMDGSVMLPTGLTPIATMAVSSVNTSGIRKMASTATFMSSTMDSTSIHSSKLSISSTTAGASSDILSTGVTRHTGPTPTPSIITTALSTFSTIEIKHTLTTLQTASSALDTRVTVSRDTTTKAIVSHTTSLFIETIKSRDSIYDSQDSIFPTTKNILTTLASSPLSSNETVPTAGK